MVNEWEEIEKGIEITFQRALILFNVYLVSFKYWYNCGG